MKFEYFYNHITHTFTEFIKILHLSKRNSLQKVETEIFSKYLYFDTSNHAVV